MRIAPIALALFMVVVPVAAQVQDLGLATDEQILLKQVMTDKRAVFARNLGLTDSESRAFWPVYDEYEGKAKKINDRFLALVNDYVAKYAALTDTDATAMLKEKMAIEKERAALKQTYTRKVAKVLPAKKALRYSQIETRMDLMIQRDVYTLIPLAN
jgi:hypothetical protein